MLDGYDSSLELLDRRLGVGDVLDRVNGIDDGLGLEQAKKIIKEKGWDSFIEASLVSGADNAFRGLTKCIRILSTPADLKDEDIEKLLSRANNDLEWTELKAYLEFRQQAEELNNHPIEVCWNIVQQAEAVFYDVEKVKEIARDILENNQGVYGYFINELRRYYDEQFINGLEKFSITKLLESVEPVFLYNLVMNAYPENRREDKRGVFEKYGNKQEMVRSIILPDEAMRELAQKVVRENRRAFQYAFHWAEQQRRDKYGIVKKNDGYNFVAYVRELVKKEIGADIKESWGYAVNSLEIALSEKVVGLYNPWGEMLATCEIERGREEVVDSPEAQDIFSMKNILVDDEYSPSRKALAILLIFWDRFPKEITERAQEVFQKRGVDIIDYVRTASPSFEVTLGYVGNLYRFIDKDLISEVENFVKKQEDKINQMLQKPKVLSAGGLKKIVGEKYFPDQKDEEMVKAVMSQLSFEAVRYLEENLGVSFKDFSLRETFSLLLYLQTKKNGVGYENLCSLVSGADSTTDKRNRIRAFLSLSYGGLEFGDRVIAINEKFRDNPEVAKQIFAKYSEFVVTIKEVEDYLKEQFDKDDSGLVQEIGSNLLSRGQAIFVLFADEEMTPKRAMKRLEEVDAGVSLFLSSFKLLKTRGENISLEDLKDSRFEVISGPELAKNEDVVLTMERIYLENYKEYPKEFKAELLNSLRNNLNNPHSTFYVLYHREKAVAFSSSVLKTDSNVVHFANLNIDPQYHRARLGQAMMEASVDRVPVKYSISMDVLPDSITERNLTGEKGFEVVGEYELEGVKVHKLFKS